MVDHGIVSGMSRSENVWDIAAMVSLFPSLKTERTVGPPMIEHLVIIRSYP
ncbi:hypothetical protein ACYCVF_36640 [Bradyrhizobium sp. 1.29L]